jgi:Fe-S-cluster containining protein
MKQITLHARQNAMARSLGPLRCDGCTACCKRDLVPLDPERDDMAQLQWQRVAGRAVLAHKFNGECVYLTERGCGNYDSRPLACRRFDCRVLVSTTTADVQMLRERQNPTMREVYAAGRVRIARKGTNENA